MTQEGLCIKQVQMVTITNLYKHLSSNNDTRKMAPCCLKSKSGLNGKCAVTVSD